ncbi:MAG: hypothetical protein V9E90_03065 [Saprospiraceae bacterium]
MKKNLIILSLLTFYLNLYSQKDVNISGKKYYIKTTENIASNFKIYSLCQDQKLTKNCTNYYLNTNGNYIKLPLEKAQISSALKASNFNSIKGIKKLSLANSTIYFFQNTSGNTYIASDESDNLILYPVSPTNDIIAIGKKTSQGPKSLDEKCGKACPFVIPPTCQTHVNGKMSDCFLKIIEAHERCRLKCKGKIRMSSIAPFEGIVINTKAN